MNGCVLASLYVGASDEEPHGVGPPRMGDGASPPGRDPQAVQTHGGLVDRPECRAPTADHAGWGTQGYLIGWNSVLSSESDSSEEIEPKVAGDGLLRGGARRRCVSKSHQVQIRRYKAGC